LLIEVSVEVATMKATGRDDGAATAYRQLPSIDSLIEWRRPILVPKRRPPRFVWESGWAAVVAGGATWLLLFGLALFALSMVARPQSAEVPIDPWDAEIATPVAKRIPSSSKNSSRSATSPATGTRW
jgi:hypothetical protein